VDSETWAVFCRTGISLFEANVSRRDLPTALDWLDNALPLRDPGLVTLRTDPLLDPLRNEPRFQAIERQLKFP